MSETKWIDWHPKVGDVRPEVYRCRRWCLDGCWIKGTAGGKKLSNWSQENFYYQIPAPVETAMKYWQPRREPLSKGWTLSDVPEGILCSCGEYGKERYLMRDSHGVVWEDHGCTTESPSECRVIRVIDPIPAGAMTLDKVPENVKCVVTDGDQQFIRYRQGSVAKGIGSSEPEITSPKLLTVLHILDPLPEVAYTLETLPVGRVIEHDDKRLFKDMEGDWTELDEITGCPLILPLEQPPRPYKKWQVTDIIMELKEVV